MIDARFDKHALCLLRRVPEPLTNFFSSAKQHPTRHLKTVVSVMPHKAAMCVIETDSTFDVERSLDHAVSDDAGFRFEEPSEGIMLTIDAGADLPTVLVQRTQNASVPIYIGQGSGQIAVSWDFWAALQAIERPVINLQACQRYILEGPRFYRDSVIQNVSLLAGSQTAEWSGDKVAFREAERIERFDPGTLCAGAEVADAFLGLIEQNIEGPAKRSSFPVLELSGGQDSSCVAGALGRAGHSKMRSYGLIQSGVSGRQQAERRMELIGKYGFEDRTRLSSICKPFTSLKSDRANAITPFDEIYRLGIEACIDAFDNSTIDLVLTGIGGDELSIYMPYTEPAEAALAKKLTQGILFGSTLDDKTRMASTALSSAVVSSFCRADMFLKRGIWAKNPFLDFRLVHFCQQVPSGLKDGRRLNLIALAKLGMSDFFLFPRFRENFQQVYESDLREFEFDSFFESSVLQANGVVDISALCDQFRGFINTGRCDLPLVIFMNAVRLELILRRALAS